MTAVAAPELPDPRTARLVRHVKRALWVPSVLGMFFTGGVALIALAQVLVDALRVSVGVQAEPEFALEDFFWRWSLVGISFWVQLVVLGVGLAAFAWVLPVRARDVELAERSLRDEHLRARRAAASEEQRAATQLRAAAALEQRAAAERQAAVARSRARSIARSTLRPSAAGARGPRFDVPPTTRIAGARR